MSSDHQGRPTPLGVLRLADARYLIGEMAARTIKDGDSGFAPVEQAWLRAAIYHFQVKAGDDER